MSLFAGARALANGAGQICTPLHIFLAALPPYAQTYLDEPPRISWDRRVSPQVRNQWFNELQPKLVAFHVGQQGLENDEFKAIEREAQTRANLAQKPADAVALALVLAHPTIREIVTRTETITPTGMNPDTLARELDDRFAISTPGVSPIAGQVTGAPQPVQDPVAAEMARATKLLDDGFLVVVKPTTDQRFKSLQTVDINTFLTTLADSARNRATVACVGQEGTLISLLDSAVADRLATTNSFSGLQSQLNDYTGGLFKMDADTLVSRGGRGGAPKAVTILRAAKAKLAAMPDKPILLIDHLEGIQGQGDDITELCFEIGERGRILVFGIYHAPDDKSDYTYEARLGRDNIKVIPFRPYDAEQTKGLIDSFFKLYWADSNPNRNFKFPDDAFDVLIALAPGSWHDLKHKVLPGLVIDITQDALETAFRGDAGIRETANCALLALKELKREELPRTKFRAKFEPILKRAEEDVKRLIPPKPSRRLFGLLPPAPPPQPDPNKPIEITGPRIVAELICHNRSEFHYPDPEFGPVGRRN